MNEHTLGPWRRSTLDQWAVLGGDNSVVCYVVPWDTSGSREEDHANVRLIAAAPELLEALQSLVATVASDEWFAAWREEAEAAIAKATTGEKG
jgi:hypothetical protein